MPIAPNEDFLLAQYERFGAGGAALDYGCGDGLLIDGARERGYDFWGVEKYYDGHANWKERSAERTSDESSNRIRLLDDNDRIPFDDGSFGFVCSNQVLEHVHDIDLTVAEIARVMRPNAISVHLFPTREIVVEPHLRIPLYHRIPRVLRRVYARPFHQARLATASQKDTDWGSWFTGMNDFFDNHVRLRTRREIEAALGKYFSVEPIELEKLSFHRGRRLPRSNTLRLVEHRRVGVALRLRRL